MIFPTGRMGLTEFLRFVGIGRTTFYDNYRDNPRWILRMDLRKDHRGCLHVCAKEARRFAAELKGELAWEASERTDALLRRCPHCDEQIRAKAKVCKFCKRDILPEEEHGVA